jgi:hypothetical protein
MIRCRELAELLTSDRLRDASLRVRVEARLHLWMCRHCARLARQMEQLRAAARKLADSFGPRETDAPGEGLEERLVLKLSKKV